MSNSKDKTGVRQKMDQDKPYTVGHKKPPVQFQFKPGQSGNPRGRPKGRCKDRILAQQMIKNAINKGGSALVGCNHHAHLQCGGPARTTAFGVT